MQFFAALWTGYEMASYGFQGNYDVTETLEFGTQLHGGFSSASFVLSSQRGSNTLNYRAYLGSHCIIYDLYGRSVYEGRISESGLTDEGISVISSGYYAEGSHIIVPTELWQSANTLVSDVVWDCVQIVPSWNHTRAHLVGAAFTLGSLDSEEESKVTDIIERVLKFGYSDDDLRTAYFAIYNDRIPRIFPERDNTRYPDWFVYTGAKQQGNLRQSITLENVYNRIFVLYDTAGDDSTGPTLYPNPADDVVSQNRYGTREGVLNVGEYGLNVGIALRDVAIRKYAYPEPVLSLEISGLVRSAGGMIDYPYMMRAGQTLVIVDLDELSVLSHIVSGQVGATAHGFILGTQFSSKNNTIRVDLGSADRRLDYLLSRLGIEGGLS